MWIVGDRKGGGLDDREIRSPRPGFVSKLLSKASACVMMRDIFSCSLECLRYGCLWIGFATKISPKWRLLARVTTCSTVWARKLLRQDYRNVGIGCLSISMAYAASGKYLPPPPPSPQWALSFINLDSGGKGEGWQKEEDVFDSSKALMRHSIVSRHVE